MAKKLISRNLYSLDLEGSLDDVIKYLKEVKKDHGSEYANLRISWERYDDTYRYYLCGNSLETDYEEKFRLTAEKNMKENQEKRDRETFERFKKKFGKQ